ncbi:YceH family protein [Niveibacterium sp. SC-1]|uniref:YceH family protein n=1 Tax=Niveibacterium sp. SC-1 TaxID=3135646 RepID=UPI00311DEA39
MSETSLLTPLEARILGVLVEKEHTVPDTYPLSLNALTAGCNQKTSREVVMEASDTEVLAALEDLRERVFVIESSGSRVTRYSHNIGRVLQVPSQSVALLTTLMLRGPQTVAELRANSERLHRFTDASSVEAFLSELAERSAGALVRLLPRAPGARESRWAHLLCGEPAVPQYSAAPASAGGGAGELAARVGQLEDEVATLRAFITRLSEQLGVEGP